jgi:hypothetical protein
VRRQTAWLLVLALLVLARRSSGPRAAGPQVPAKLTPATAADVRAALLAAGLPAAAVPIVLAHSALETAAWRGLWGWNVGNIVATGNVAWQALPGVALPFRVYPSLAAGAADFVALLAARGAVAPAAAGDLAGYVAALKAGGYAGPGADYVAYQAGIARYVAAPPT